MVQNSLFEWEGREYDHDPKSADWYWALGIISVAGVIAAVLFGSYLIAVLIIIGAITFALHVAKEPPLHRFRMVETGIFIGEEFHPFEHMLSFSVLEDVEGELPPVISIHTKNWLAPHLVIPLDGVDVDAIYEYFFHHVDEEEHKPTFVDAVAALLRF